MHSEFWIGVGVGAIVVGAPLIALLINIANDIVQVGQWVFGKGK